MHVFCSQKDTLDEKVYHFKPKLIIYQHTVNNANEANKLMAILSDFFLDLNDFDLNEALTTDFLTFLAAFFDLSIYVNIRI